MSSKPHGPYPDNPPDDHTRKVPDRKNVKSVLVDKIPAELKLLDNWIVWREELRANGRGDVKKTKAPHNARTGNQASSTSPKTWSTFAAALAAFGRGGYDGLGFCILGTGYVGVDLDSPFDAEGNLEAWAGKVLKKLNTYCERSPNQGIHALAKVTLPAGARQREFKIGRAHV